MNWAEKKDRKKKEKKQCKINMEEAKAEESFRKMGINGQLNIQKSLKDKEHESLIEFHEHKAIQVRRIPVNW